MTKRLLHRCVLLAAALAAGCDNLEQNPVATSTREAVFGTESGLALYTNSFYSWMPDANNLIQSEMMSDYGARRDVPSFVRPGVFNARVTESTSSGTYETPALGGDANWGWGTLRNINYFLVNNTNPAIPESVRRHHDGLARFFRAWFYFEKVKRYGDVPWIDKPLGVEDPELYGPRTPRAVVMDRVLEDLNFAIQNIGPVNEPSRTLITRDVALALKSRVALFEGTMRKYHPDLGLAGTANAWLNESVSASRALIDGRRYSLFTGAGPEGSYRQLFVRDQPVSQEIILAVTSSTPLGVRHMANWIFTSATTGVRFSFIRPFIHTYLNLDGTPFTNRSGYQTMTFAEETQNRDRRLQQTIRTPGYRRPSGSTTVAAPPAFSYTYTGYHPIKWSVDDPAADGGNNNTNAVSLFRYAEVLLNYAEARAELGALTAADWAQTVGALRARAGITGGLNTLPTAVDPYLRSTYFPDISNPAILEIRRERGIELAMEGFRFYDLVRWRRGELMAMEWRGIYVPQANRDMDLDGDGRVDVHFYTPTLPANRQSGVQYISVAGNDFRLANRTSGEIVWRNDIPRRWEAKNYLYPIPESHLLTNPALKQNPGW